MGISLHLLAEHGDPRLTQSLPATWVVGPIGVVIAELSAPPLRWLVIAGRVSSETPSTLSCTSMFPRVAFEYGQRSCARAMSSAASAAESCGACRSSETLRVKPPPCPVGP